MTQACRTNTNHIGQFRFRCGSVLPWMGVDLTKMTTQSEGALAPQSDQELAQAISAGDSVAFGVIYDRYSAKVTAVSQRFVGSDQAHDIVHDVFLELWERASDFDSERGSMLTWLVVRARSRSIDLIRKNKRRGELLDQNPDTVRPRHVTPPSERAIERSRLRTAIMTLEHDMLEVVKLAYYKGASSAEIAETLEIPIGTVKSRMRRARDILAPIVEGLA